MEPFGDRQPQAVGAVRQNGCVHAERRFRQQRARERERQRVALRGEALRADERAAEQGPRPHLGHVQAQRAALPVDQVPGVGREFALDIAQEARRPEQGHVLLAAQQAPQQRVEADEVIHVGVRDERVGDLEQLARREGAEVPQVEDQRAAVELQGDEQAGVPERSVDQTRAEAGRHHTGRCFFTCWLTVR